MSLRSAVVVCTLVVVAAACAVAVLTHAKELPNYSIIDEADQAALPHPDNADDNIVLTCMACNAGSILMNRELDKVRAEFERQPERFREYHALAAIDGLCKKNFLKMGLLSYGPGKPVEPRFVHEDMAAQFNADSVLKGSWITGFWKQKCDDLVTEAEENMDKMIKGDPVDLCPACVEMEKKKLWPYKPKKAASKKGGKKKTNKPTAEADL